MYTSLTWSEIRERLKDRVEHKPFWDAEEALGAFNEALRFYNLLTGRWTDQASILTTANQYLYTVPTALLYRTRIAHIGLSLSPTSREDLNLGRYTWRSETTASGGDVPTRPMLWAPVSLRSIYIWPADAVSNNNLLFDGVAATPVLVEDGDTVDLGDELLGILLGYGLHALAFKKGGPYFQATLPYFRAFLKFAGEENGQIKTSKVYRRWMGLDHRDQKPLRGGSTLMDQVVGRL
jgi:hypothetical protein